MLYNRIGHGVLVWINYHDLAHFLEPILKEAFLGIGEAAKGSAAAADGQRGHLDLPFCHAYNGVADRIALLAAQAHGIALIALDTPTFAFLTAQAALGVVPTFGLGPFKFK